ncbi:TPA: type II secretion system protein GspE [Candidatus Dependentiae bacterium]|nr:MAG: putative ATPases involved in pili biogenesis, PilB-like protein s [candidate division TM6 bacterium GW2011_GWE2_31_21]KKP53802.1 MAG: putative ATPases involved in pili biogenesis, PilB-like protein s [candidate division TM6 bacterium GW2011_GWF2_33_332]HBS47582.1 type II secretion system protein GspE [Candidatus Dependentiae bacterium]HBZ73731.1 type II secretion system protein GspE [Candidatus Dependentiae bacterium]
MERKKISEILIQKGIITEEQHRECQKIKKETGKITGQVLLEKGYVTKQELAEALAIQMSVPFIDKITDKMINTEILSKIPLKFLRQHIVIPIIYNDQKIIVTADPRDLQPIDDLSLLLKGNAGYAVASDETILEGINKYYPLETSSEMMAELKEGEAEEFELATFEEKDLLEMANEAPIIKLVNHIFFQAVKEEASDIHIEAFEKEVRIRYRIDGEMYQKVLPPKRYQAAIVSRIKIMANLNIAEKRLPQDGRIQIKVGDKQIDLRVSILPCNFGERVSIRLLDKGKEAFKLENLGMRPEDLKIVLDLISRPNGIFFVTGPTGSGKTSTLYAILNKLNQPNVNIITVEDPVEYTINGVNQVQVIDKIGLTFAAALRSILRQDPDIVLIGEIRDAETAQIATQASLTGHLVLSTIHTNDAPSTITRLADMGVEPYLTASTVICIMAQRLVRKLCSKCKQPFTPDAELFSRLGITKEAAAQIKFYKNVGCEECLNTGFRGRLPIFEVMQINDEIRKLIVAKANAAEIRHAAEKEDFKSLLDDGIRRIKDGLTTIEEVLTVAYAEKE